MQFRSTVFLTPHRRRGTGPNTPPIRFLRATQFPLSVRTTVWACVCACTRVCVCKFACVCVVVHFNLQTTSSPRMCHGRSIRYVMVLFFPPNLIVHTTENRIHTNATISRHVDRLRYFYYILLFFFFFNSAESDGFWPRVNVWYLVFPFSYLKNNFKLWLCLLRVW